METIKIPKQRLDNTRGPYYDDNNVRVSNHIDNSGRYSYHIDNNRRYNCYYNDHSDSYYDHSSPIFWINGLKNQKWVFLVKKENNKYY